MWQDLSTDKCLVVYVLLLLCEWASERKTWRQVNVKRRILSARFTFVAIILCLECNNNNNNTAKCNKYNVLDPCTYRKILAIPHSYKTDVKKLWSFFFFFFFFFFSSRSFTCSSCARLLARSLLSSYLHHDLLVRAVLCSFARFDNKPTIACMERVGLAVLNNNNNSLDVDDRFLGKW